MRIHLKMRKAGQNIDEQLNIKLGHISQCAPSVYITHTDQMNTHALRHFSFLGGIIYKYKRVISNAHKCCHIAVTNFLNLEGSTERFLLAKMT